MKSNRTIWWIVTGIALTGIIGGVAYVWYQSKKYKDAKANRNIQLINVGG
jgi:hypothetical protein